MNYKIQPALADGFAVLVYTNELGTTTVALIDGEDWSEVQTTINELPDDQIVDFAQPCSDENLAEGVAQARRKLNREGEYANWDERMRQLGLD